MDKKTARFITEDLFSTFNLSNSNGQGFVQGLIGNSAFATFNLKDFVSPGDTKDLSNYYVDLDNENYLMFLFNAQVPKFSVVKCTNEALTIKYSISSTLYNHPCYEIINFTFNVELSKAPTGKFKYHGETIQVYCSEAEGLEKDAKLIIDKIRSIFRSEALRNGFNKCNFNFGAAKIKNVDLLAPYKFNFNDTLITFEELGEKVISDVLTKQELSKKEPFIDIIGSNSPTSISTVISIYYLDDEKKEPNMDQSPFCEFALSYDLEKYPTIESIDLETLLGTFQITFEHYENSGFESPQDVMNFIKDFISQGPLINALQDGWKNTFQQIENFPKLTKGPYNITRFNAEAELLFLLMVSKNFNFEISHPKLKTKFVSLNNIKPVAYPYRIK